MNSSNLSYYIEKKIVGWVGQAKRDVIKWAAFSKWDKMGRRQVGRSKKAKKQGMSLMDVPFQKNPDSKLQL